jgi:hypothetical protein
MNKKNTILIDVSIKNIFWPVTQRLRHGPEAQADLNILRRIRNKELLVLVRSRNLVPVAHVIERLANFFPQKNPISQLEKVLCSIVTTKG